MKRVKPDSHPVPDFRLQSHLCATGKSKKLPLVDLLFIN